MLVATFQRKVGLLLVVLLVFLLVIITFLLLKGVAINIDNKDRSLGLITTTSSGKLLTDDVVLKGVNYGLEGTFPPLNIIYQNIKSESPRHLLSNLFQVAFSSLTSISKPLSIASFIVLTLTGAIITS